MLLDNFKRRCAGVARVCTQVLVSSQRWIGSLDNDGIEHGFQLGDVMPVCSGHDERQRDATSVHQQMAFAPIFFPDRWDWVQRFPVPVALSSSPRQYFAIARRYLQTRRTRQVRVSTGLQRRQPSPIPGSVRGLRWHCRNAQTGVLSTDSLSVEQTRCPQKPIAGPWACVHHLISASTTVRQPTADIGTDQMVA